ncbi:hypothetical protein [Fibrella aquatilis]|uniref:Right handed beta helix domain-containing protein n=1 Tax=Fibrella aquatilis TaxID=2817059 RepID=A0A939K0P7_9BACT|nr:hypothetical protein [Fibrella aquatilis]MBO0934419.1 hypothetical protein [Fibrella aquatilis]
MKTIYFFLLTALVGTFATQQAEAKIWRVNNRGFSATFTTLQAANNSNLVVPGDTIHLEGSPDLYAGAVLNKRLIVIGPGYFLDENPATSTTVLAAIIAGFDLNKGSEGSQLIGLHVGKNSAGISINTSNILIKRCRIDYEIGVTYGISDIRIVQNFFAGSNTSSLLQANSASFPANVIFNNNICQKTLILQDGYTMLECRNNVFDCPAIAGKPSIKMNVGSFQNNILKNPNANVSINGGSNLNVSYNIGGSPNQFGTANNNIVVTDFTTLFVDPATNTTDGDYQLKPNSPGSNNGSDGADRGAFGGLSVTSRYTLSGVAPIPVIYEISSSGVAGPNGMNVSIKARTIK